MITRYFFPIDMMKNLKTGEIRLKIAIVSMARCLQIRFTAWKQSLVRTTV